jgi:para-aminobenzoate synthetase component 1
VLESWDTETAFDELETYLAESGFFRDPLAALVADVYLGYRLSDALRRRPGPAPPDPCSLPLAACSVRPLAEEEPVVGEFAVGEWERTWTDDEYARAIAAVKAAIARGDVYQVNLVQHLSAPFAGDTAAIASRLAHLRPLYPHTLGGDGWTIVSASPELFLARRGRRVWTAPIKGTRPLADGTTLRGAEKDEAEHVMIVDLERNDLSRICEPGTVRWPELMTERELAGVVHLVSTVEGRLRDGVTLAELLAAVFPGGSVTGAPKIAAIDLIAALEAVGRGASMGALGRIYPNGDFDLALTIRTFAIVDGRIHLWVGGGIVWDSDPAAEIEESWVKARPLLAALGTPVGQPAGRASPAPTPAVLNL